MNAGSFARRFLVPRWGVSLYYFLKYRCRVSTRAEVELSPFLKIGHRFDRLVSVLDEGAAALAQDGLEVRFLIDVSRTFGVENAMR